MLPIRIVIPFHPPLPHHEWTTRSSAVCRGMALALWPINSNGNWNKPRSSSDIRVLRLPKCEIPEGEKFRRFSPLFFNDFFFFFFLFFYLSSIGCFVVRVNFSPVSEIFIKDEYVFYGNKFSKIIRDFNSPRDERDRLHERRKKGGVNDKIFGFALSPATETWHRSLQWLPNSVQRHEKPVCHVARSMDNINSVLLLETYRLKGNRVSRSPLADITRRTIKLPSSSYHVTPPPSPFQITGCYSSDYTANPCKLVLRKRCEWKNAWRQLRLHFVIISTTNETCILFWFDKEENIYLSKERLERRTIRRVTFFAPSRANDTFIGRLLDACFPLPFSPLAVNNIF